jgi:hypothetical protein
MLRAALEGVLPDAIRLRTEKAYFQRVFAQALAADEPAIRIMLGTNARIRRYVDGTKLERLTRWGDERPFRTDWLLWRFAILEAWLRMQEDASYARDALARLPLDPTEGRLVS